MAVKDPIILGSLGVAFIGCFIGGLGAGKILPKEAAPIGFLMIAAATIVAASRAIYLNRQENAALAFNRQHLLDARGSRAYATSRASSLASHDSLIVRDEEAGQYAAPQ